MTPIEGARFGHVNLTGADWRGLARFYVELFGCELVPPERDYRGADLDAASGLSADVAISRSARSPESILASRLPHFAFSR